MLGPLLFAVYCSPVADVIAHHDVQYHHYADDTQLHLAMRADNTTAGLSVLAECTTDVRQWYLQNGLQLNRDKSEALIVGTNNQMHAVTSSFSSVRAGVDLPVAEEMKVLGVVLDQRLTFNKHVSTVARSCNFHTQAIRHIRHLLTTDLAQILPAYWCAVGSCPGSITATLCSTVLQPTPSGVAACAEQRCSDRPPGAKTIPRHAFAEHAALAACSAEN